MEQPLGACKPLMQRQTLLVAVAPQTPVAGGGASLAHTKVAGWPPCVGARGRQGHATVVAAPRQQQQQQQQWQQQQQRHQQPAHADALGACWQPTAGTSA